jgi:inhibitor of KinA
MTGAGDARGARDGARQHRATLAALANAEIAPCGDQAVLVRLGSTISPRSHARVMAALAALDAARPAWVVDCVPAYATVLVIFDPLAVGADEVVAWARTRLAAARRRRAARRRVTIQVWYDPEVGLDLDDTARRLQVSRKRIVELHTGRAYLAHMLGFKPGFPYLGTLDERLAAPRLDAPRVSVPAGSVGIAGRQTGIYPVTCPGGWRILGRTPLRIFAPEREAPFLILPGDEVRFEAIGKRRFDELSARETAAAEEAA